MTSRKKVVWFIIIFFKWCTRDKNNNSKSTHYYKLFQSNKYPQGGVNNTCYMTGTLLSNYTQNIINYNITYGIMIWVSICENILIHWLNVLLVLSRLVQYHMFLWNLYGIKLAILCLQEFGGVLVRLKIKFLLFLHYYLRTTW